MEPLYFCRDGVLRRGTYLYNRNTREGVYERVPLQAYEQAVDRHIFLKSMTYGIVFEEGLTVGELMENLAPWAETMIGVGVLDFPAFLEEVRNDPEESETDCCEVVLRYSATIGARPAYERRFEGGREMMFGGDPMVTDELSFQEGWDMHAILKEEARAKYEGSESVAIDGLPMSQWKHLPIRIEETGRFFDETASSLNREHLSAKTPLTDARHPLVEQATHKDGTPYKHVLTFEAPCATFIAALVRGFFFEVGFFYSPICRDETVEEIRQRASDLDTGSVEFIDMNDIPMRSDPSEIRHDEDDEAEYRHQLAELDRVRALSHDLGLTIQTEPRRTTEQ